MRQMHLRRTGHERSNWCACARIASSDIRAFADNLAESLDRQMTIAVEPEERNFPLRAGTSNLWDCHKDDSFPEEHNDNRGHRFDPAEAMGEIRNILGRPSLPRRRLQSCRGLLVRCATGQTTTGAEESVDLRQTPPGLSNALVLAVVRTGQVSFTLEGDRRGRLQPWHSGVSCGTWDMRCWGRFRAIHAAYILAVDAGLGVAIGRLVLSISRHFSHVDVIKPRNHVMVASVRCRGPLRGF